MWRAPKRIFLMSELTPFLWKTGPVEIIVECEEYTLELRYCDLWRNVFVIFDIRAPREYVNMRRSLADTTKDVKGARLAFH